MAQENGTEIGDKMKMKNEMKTSKRQVRTGGRNPEKNTQ